MKRVLIIAYYFPPIIASGTNRTLGFTRNLKQFNWKPIVLTVKNSKDPWIKLGAPIPEGIVIYRTREFNLAKIVDFLHGGVSKIFSFFRTDLKTNYFREIFCIPDAQIAWLSIIKGISLAKSTDIIYVSCSPFSSALSALIIKYFSKKPLVLDFRDAWTLNPHIKHSLFHTFIIKLSEKLCLKYSNHIILNTAGALKLYQETYPQYAKKFSCIPNGYDKLTPIIKTNAEADKFRIMHIGNFYGNRTPQLILEALLEINNPNIIFHQVGENFDDLENFEGKVNIEITPTVTRQMALILMQRASLLYLKQGFEPGIKNHIAVAAKTYEYLATGLPILAELPEGDNAAIIKEYSDNSYLITSEDKNKIKESILAAYDKRNHLNFSIKESFIKDFDRKNLTETLANIFSNLK